MAHSSVDDMLVLYQQEYEKKEECDETVAIYPINYTVRAEVSSALCATQLGGIESMICTMLSHPIVYMAYRLSIHILYEIK